MTTDKVQKGFRIRKEISDELRMKSALENRSQSEIIEEALEIYFLRKKVLEFNTKGKTINES